MSDLPESDEELINRELFGTRKPALARFYMHGARNETLTMQSGYPVFEDRVYVEIRVPDDKDFMSHPASAAEIRQYREAYARFERARDWKQHNLELLPTCSPSQMATCKALGLFTIEQLAQHTPDNAPWTKGEEGDRYPALKGELPPALQPLQAEAKRFVSFVTKPRLRLVNGQLEAANV